MLVPGWQLHQGPGMSLVLEALCWPQVGSSLGSYCELRVCKYTVPQEPGCTLL